MSDHPWEREPDELGRAYHGFRTFRDLGPTRTIDKALEQLEVSKRTILRWSERYRWHERATAWDDEVHKTIDDARLTRLREMWENHVRIGQAATAKALAALQQMQVDHIPAGAAVRLLEMGTRLERDTLSMTPEDLYGSPDGDGEDDAWDKLARELGVA